MRVLVVTKTTNFERFGLRVREFVGRGQLPADDLQALQASHDEHQRTLATLLEVLHRHGVAIDETSRGATWRSESPYDAVFTVGGDGTVCAASHQMGAGELLIGIRSSRESVGYLCAGDIGAVDTIVLALVRGTLRTSTVHRLRAQVQSVETNAIMESPPVLNDILYANRNPAGTMRYVLALGDVRERQKSSGIWCATATGSTAAIHAAGGEAMAAEDDRFQFVVRELYASQRLPSGTAGESGEVPSHAVRLERGYFRDDGALSVLNRTESAILALDGQHGVIPLSFGDRVAFVRAPTLRLARASR